MVDLSFIEDEVRRARPMLMGTGVVLTAMAVGLCFVPVEAGATAWVHFFKWGLLALWLVGGVKLVQVGLRPASQHPAVVLLREAPQSIVWAHVTIRQVNGVHSATMLVLHTEAGKTLHAPLPRSEAGERQGLTLVATIAPRATMGFRPEYQRQFARNPAALRRA